MQQQELFSQNPEHYWQLDDDCFIQLYRDFLEPELSHQMLADLTHQLAWEQSEIRIAGKLLKIPRLNAWYGDSHAVYRYSGKKFRPQPWTQSLLTLKTCVETRCKTDFNSVLANLYRDQNDSVAWHSDNEPELGKNPLIASLSLGESRRFQCRSRHDRQLPRIDIELPHNSLLIMGGAMQSRWQHQIPKTRIIKSPRINLTFRQVQTGSDYEH